MSPFRIGMFFVVMAALLSLTHYYLYYALIRQTTQHPSHRRLGATLLGTLFLSALLARPAFQLLPYDLKGSFSLLAWGWLALAIYLVMAVAVFRAMVWLSHRRNRKVPDEALKDALFAGPVVDADRREFLSRAAAGSAVVVSVGMVGYGTWRAYTPPKPTEVSVKLAKLPRGLDGLRIAQLTDVHVGPLIDKKFLDDVVQRVNALKPNMVAITGDLVDGSVDMLGPTVASLRHLKSRYGTFFVNGNHEYYSGVDEWSQALRGMDITVLRNQRVTIGDAGGSFNLVGVDDYSRRGEGGMDMEAAYAGRDPDRAGIFLLHQPQTHVFHDAVARGMDLTLCGHTHGGQMFPWTLLIPLIWRYSAGLYKHDTGQTSGHIYVSRGTGFWGPPVRVGSEPGIVAMTLTV